jgi:hypothetical protein
VIHGTKTKQKSGGQFHKNVAVFGRKKEGEKTRGDFRMLEIWGDFEDLGIWDVFQETKNFEEFQG